MQSKAATVERYLAELPADRRAAIETVRKVILDNLDSGYQEGMLYGMIGILGVKIWVQNKVNFANPVNLTTAAVALIIGIADYTWTIGELTFTGIALGSAAALVIYHGMKAIAKARGTVAEPETEQAGLPPAAKAALNAAAKRAPEKR